MSSEGLTTQADSNDRRLPALEQLADRFGTAGRVATVFGEPVQREAVTVIPVARARWGLGGGWGGGQDEKSGGSGGGAGGGLTVDPIGYIEITDAGARFRPVFDPMALLVVALIGGLIGLLITRRRG
jgi:uncharacterized spore protein YtfJ